MSLLLRSLMRDARPVSRLVRRLENDLYEDWPVGRKLRRTMPIYEPLDVMEDMSRQVNMALNQVQDLFEDMDRIEDWSTRFGHEHHSRREPQAMIKRTETGGLQLALDMKNYKPEDLKIKLVDDNLVVEADSESSGKNSYSKSHFKRWFKLPEDVKVDEIKSKLTEGNKLLIDLPLNKPIESSERSIPIEFQKNQKDAIGENGSHKEGQHGQRQEDERVAARQ